MAKTSAAVSLDRTLPHNIEAEKSVLGAMIRDMEATLKANEILGEGGFYNPGHQIIYEAILELTTSNVHVDLVTLAAALKQKGELE
ncbi:replicative DNA helicase, partial [bacterium]|nr:replicative DNA helicase [bacterium]